MDTVKKDDFGDNECISVKKVEIKQVKFWLSQKIEICFSLKVKICLGLKIFIMLVLQGNLIL